MTAAAAWDLIIDPAFRRQAQNDANDVENAKRFAQLLDRGLGAASRQDFVRQMFNNDISSEEWRFGQRYGITKELPILTVLTPDPQFDAAFESLSRYYDRQIPRSGAPDSASIYALSDAIEGTVLRYKRVIDAAREIYRTEYAPSEDDLWGPAVPVKPHQSRPVLLGGSSSGSRPVPLSRRASGGFITGPGSGTSDSVPAWLSNGEWVVRAGAVDALGQHVLGMLNQWDLLSPDQRAAVGGMLSQSSAADMGDGDPAGASPLLSGVWPARFSGGGPVGGSSLFSAMVTVPALVLSSVATAVSELYRRNQADAEAAAAADRERARQKEANDARREELGGQIDSMNDALDAAKQRLAAAKQAFDDYNNSVATGVRIGTDFTTALGAQSKAQDALTDAVRTQTDAQKALAVAKASGTDAQIASATRALAEADQKVAAAKDQTGGFLSFLQKGAESAAAFATQIDNLRAAGASSEVVKKIAELGAASGGSAAGELLAGGSSSIAQANYLVQLVADLSNKTGLAAAKQYYGPAVDAAQYSVNSITAQLAALQASFDAIPKQAEGGIVTRATLAVVGEAGPEAIIPLNRAGSLGSGSAVHVSVTVHGSVVQENDLVVSVRDGIAQLMRRRGLDPSIIGV